MDFILPFQPQPNHGWKSTCPIFLNFSSKKSHKKNIVHQNNTFFGQTYGLNSMITFENTWEVCKGKFGKIHGLNSMKRCEDSWELCKQNEEHLAKHMEQIQGTQRKDFKGNRQNP